MFISKKCNKCNKKIEKDFEFCPYCGLSLKDPIKEREDYGMLGLNDNISDVNKIFNSFMRPGMLDKMVSSILRNIENESRMEESQTANSNNFPNLNPDFQLYINGKKVPINQNSIQINNGKPQIQKQTAIKIDEELIKNSAKLPRKEAKTKLTRLSNKLIYELETPDLENLNTVLINKLEESLEIKAYTKKIVYYKNLPLKLPLIKYYIKENNLFLEFQAKN